MLKKIAVFVLVVTGLCMMWVCYNMPVFFDEAKSYDLYLKSDSSDALIVSTDFIGALFTNGVRGISCNTAREGFDLYAFLKKHSAKQVFTETFKGGVNYYAYSPRIKYCKYIRGEKINLQVSVTENCITLGSPIIYGSF